MSRDELIFMSEVCEQTEQFDDMLLYMKKVMNSNEELSFQDRNLLSTAFQSSVETRRFAWGVLSFIETKEKESKFLVLLQDYRNKIESELDKICQEMIKLLDTKLIESAKDDPQSLVYYEKMKGDYYRYIAECSSGEKNINADNNAFETYSKANEIAKTYLDTTDPVRLGLCLNFSVYHHDLKNDAKEACTVAKQAFDDAIVDIDKISEVNYKDSTSIMKLLRDNLIIWTSELKKEEEKEKKKKKEEKEEKEDNEDNEDNEHHQ